MLSERRLAETQTPDQTSNDKVSILFVFEAFGSFHWRILRRRKSSPSDAASVRLKL